MIDAEEGITEQDKKIAGLAHEAGKGIIVVVNKWDLIKKDTHTMNRFEKEIRQEFSFMPYAPLLFISVKTGQPYDERIETGRRSSGAAGDANPDRAAQCGHRRCDADEAAAV